MDRVIRYVPYAQLFLFGLGILICTAALLSPVRTPAADCSVGYVQGPGGYYRSDDRSGPYFITSGCTAVPAGSAVRQSAAAYRGGTITAANASQQLMDLNPARQGFTIQNQSTGDIYIRIGAAATTTNASLRVAPGQLYESSVQHVSTNVIYVTGATAGAAFYATEF